MSNIETAQTKLTADDFKRLSKKSMLVWLKDAALDWAIIITTFAILASAQNILLIIPALLIMGNRQHALTVLGHEGAHFALSKSKRINDLVSNVLAFWSLGLTTSGYRNVHMKHHKHTNAHDDPELAHRAARAPQWDLPMSRKKIAKYSLLDLCGFSLSDYIIIVTFSKPDKNAEYLSLVLFHLAFIGIAFTVGLWWVPVLWYVSLVSSFMMFFRLRTFLEHLGTTETHRLYLNWWQRHFIAPHNIWYHWEHHNYPTVAYHKLPEVRELFQEKPVMTFGELLDFYENAPMTSSGQALKSA